MSVDPRALLAEHGFDVAGLRPVGGGDINQAFVLQSDARKLFLKIHASPPPGLFRAEALALETIAATGAIRVPEVVASAQRFLLLEFIPLVSRNKDSDAQLGAALARLHQNTAERHGWRQDNYIGTTPQRNARSDDWQDFFAEQRLRPQIEWLIGAGASHRLADLGEALVGRLPELFVDYTPPAALLHGDLWSGNAAATPTGEPVVYDPASYYGDPETDLAMSELFGGFSPAFYAAYESVRPIHPGYAHRKRLYQLYHLLNHANLFGGGYLSRAESVMHELINFNPPPFPKGE